MADCTIFSITLSIGIKEGGMCRIKFNSHLFGKTGDDGKIYYCWTKPVSDLNVTKVSKKEVEVMVKDLAFVNRILRTVAVHDIPLDTLQGIEYNESPRE